MRRLLLAVLGLLLGASSAAAQYTVPTPGPTPAIIGFPTKDTYMDELAPTANFGTSDTLYVGLIAGGKGSARARLLAHFDMAQYGLASDDLVSKCYYVSPMIDYGGTGFTDGEASVVDQDGVTIADEWSELFTTAIVYGDPPCPSDPDCEWTTPGGDYGLPTVTDIECSGWPHNPYEQDGPPYSTTAAFIQSITAYLDVTPLCIHAQEEVGGQLHMIFKRSDVGEASGDGAYCGFASREFNITELLEGVFPSTAFPYDMTAEMFRYLPRLEIHTASGPGFLGKLHECPAPPCDLRKVRGTKGKKSVEVTITGTATVKVMCRVCDHLAECPEHQIGTDVTSTDTVEFTAWCEEVWLRVQPYTDGRVYGWLRPDRIQ